MTASYIFSGDVLQRVFVSVFVCLLLFCVFFVCILSVSLCVFLSLSVSLSLYPPPPVCLSVCLSGFCFLFSFFPFSVCLWLCFSVCLCLSVSLCFSLCFCSVCLFVCLSLPPSLLFCIRWKCCTPSAARFPLVADIVSLSIHTHTSHGRPAQEQQHASHGLPTQRQKKHKPLPFPPEDRRLSASSTSGARFLCPWSLTFCRHPRLPNTRVRCWQEQTTLGVWRKWNVWQPAWGLLAGTALETDFGQAVRVLGFR